MKVNNFLILLILGLGLCPQSILANDPTRPDIMVPKSANTAKVRSLKLTMIQTNDRASRAVINGRSYEVGDQLGSYKVKSIGTSEVLLQNNKGTVRLSLITKGALRKKS